MIRKTMVSFKHFAVVVVAILCSWINLGDGMKTTNTSHSQPFVVDIRMPGVRTFQVCLNMAAYIMPKSGDGL